MSVCDVCVPARTHCKCDGSSSVKHSSPMQSKWQQQCRQQPATCHTQRLSSPLRPQGNDMPLAKILVHSSAMEQQSPHKPSGVRGNPGEWHDVHGSANTAAATHGRGLLHSSFPRCHRRPAMLDPLPPSTSWLMV